MLPAYPGEIDIQAIRIMNVVFRRKVRAEFVGFTA